MNFSIILEIRIIKKPLILSSKLSDALDGEDKNGKDKAKEVAKKLIDESDEFVIFASSMIENKTNKGALGVSGNTLRLLDGMMRAMKEDPMVFEALKLAIVKNFFDFLPKG
jgi:hypothetical protein